MRIFRINKCERKGLSTRALTKTYIYFICIDIKHNLYCLLRKHTYTLFYFGHITIYRLFLEDADKLAASGVFLPLCNVRHINSNRKPHTVCHYRKSVGIEYLASYSNRGLCFVGTLGCIFEIFLTVDYLKAE